MASERQLYDAASQGDVTALLELLNDDPYLVDGISFPCSRNLLHIAAMLGQTSIVEAVLNLNPRLAWILDSQKLSPLHIAAAEGHIEICQKLLPVAPEACFWRDIHDMNPLHVAAMKGHVEILEYFLQVSPLPAMERLRAGATVLHLCVKHDQLAALKTLVERLGEFVYATDENGETILHLAVRCDQLETTKYLVENKKIEKRIRNSMGKTPLDILDESPTGTTGSFLEHRRILLTMPGPSLMSLILPPKLTKMTMVVAVLIATVAFQTTVNPPGGVWQDDTSAHKAGDAIIAYSNPKNFKALIRANTLAFFSSIVTIFLIVGGWETINRFFLFIAWFSVSVSLFAVTASFEASKRLITSNGKSPGISSLTIFYAMLLIFKVAGCFINVLELYLYWKRKPQRQEFLITTGPVLHRFLYRIFLRLDTWYVYVRS